MNYLLSLVEDPVKHLADVFQGAWDLADHAAGELLIPYNDPSFHGAVSSDVQHAIDEHEWVSSEMQRQMRDLEDARLSDDLSALVMALRKNAAVEPIISEQTIRMIEEKQAE